MGNMQYQGAIGRAEAVNAAHSAAAARLALARERIDDKCARTAFLHSAYRTSMTLLSNMTGEMPAYNPDVPAVALSEEDEEALQLELDGRVRKVLGLIAVLINEGEAEVTQMETLIDLIRAMDVRFFDFANDPIDSYRDDGEKMKRTIYTYLRRYGLSTLIGVKEV